MKDIINKKELKLEIFGWTYKIPTFMESVRIEAQRRKNH